MATRKELEEKLAVAKKTTLLPEKQREQMIAMYTRKIAEFEAADKKPEPKASAKKSEPKHASGKIITFDDGFKWKVVSKDFAEKNFKKVSIYKIIKILTSF